jgi:DNA invertase Pin-like site-specific DNA recombinase
MTTQTPTLAQQLITTEKPAAMYLRVSTEDQDNANQETGVLNYATLHAYTITAQVRDTASTRIPLRERQIWTMLTDATPGSTILVAEISRLARNTLEVLELAALAASKDISIIATKNDLTLNGSLESKITTTILALAAEIEREFIRARTTEALHRARANGKTLGRPKGSGGKNKLDGRESELQKYLDKRITKTDIAKLMDISRGTLDTKLAKMQATNANILTAQLF